MNAAFEFARQLMRVKSPSEFFELSAAHMRKQFETFTEQTQQVTTLAQKATTYPSQKRLRRAPDGHSRNIRF